MAHRTDRSHPRRGAVRANGTDAPAPGDPDRLIDLRDVPSRWPTMDGMVSPAPTRWRYHAEDLAAVADFYKDLLWAAQLELDGVRWPGRDPGRDDPSIFPALRDVARLWGVSSSEEPLPSTSTARQTRNARRHRYVGNSRGTDSTSYES